MACACGILKRGVWVVALLFLTSLAGVAWWSREPASATEVTVYKSPTCDCCNSWIQHLRASGFTVVARDLRDVGEVKARLGVRPELASCHTAVVDGYVIEGHVPADLIRRLLAERPPVRGLAVPDMPVGSPGMEQGDRKDPYTIFAFDDSGRTTVYDRR